jgi:hypothetical protein
MRVIATLCVIGALTLSGCASTHNWFYDELGLLCAESRSLVIGTGDTELVIVNPCGGSVYTTSNTGISENGKEAIGNVVEGIAKGAVKGMVPVP